MKPLPLLLATSIVAVAQPSFPPPRPTSLFPPSPKLTTIQWDLQADATNFNIYMGGNSRVYTNVIGVTNTNYHTFYNNDDIFVSVTALGLNDSRLESAMSDELFIPSKVWKTPPIANLTLIVWSATNFNDRTHWSIYYSNELVITNLPSNMFFKTTLTR